MSSGKRIETTALTPTIGRQTPKNDFGDMVSRGMNHGLSVAGAVLNGPLALTAAVPGGMAVSAAGHAALAGASGIVAVGNGGSVAAGGTVVGGASTNVDDLKNNLAQHDPKSLAYINLQEAIQHESRLFNTVTNIAKVRHDSAKAAINNVR